MKNVAKAIVALSLLAVTCAAGGEPPPADAPALYAGCEVTTTQPGQASFECEGVFGSASTGSVAPETAIEASVNGMRAAFKGPVIAKKAEIEVAGVNRPGVRASLFRADGEPAVAEAVIVAVPVDDDSVRVINCASIVSVPGSAERRDRIVQALASSLPAATKSTPSEWGAEGRTFVDRSLAVPDGCVLATPGQIRCETSMLSWRHGSSDFHVVNMIGPLRTEYSKLGKVEEKVVGCRLEGERTDCRLFAVRMTEGETLFVLFAGVAVRGRGIVAECDTTAEPKGALPPPCDQVLSLDSTKSGR